MDWETEHGMISKGAEIDFHYGMHDPTMKRILSLLYKNTMAVLLLVKIIGEMADLSKEETCGLDAVRDD